MLYSNKQMIHRFLRQTRYSPNGFNPERADIFRRLQSHLERKSEVLQNDKIEPVSDRTLCEQGDRSSPPKSYMFLYCISTRLGLFEQTEVLCEEESVLGIYLCGAFQNGTSYSSSNSFSVQQDKMATTDLSGHSNGHPTPAIC